MNSLAPKSLVESLDHAFCITAADRGCVCIGGIEQELNSGLTIAEEIPRIVVRNHHPGIGFALADRISQLVNR